MARSKIAISLDEQVLDRLDRLVKEAAFPNRSKAIEKRLKRNWLVRNETGLLGNARNLTRNSRNPWPRKGSPRCRRNGQNIERRDSVG